MANITISLDENDKLEFSEFCEKIGLSASGVINVFVKTVLREGRIPFEIGVDRPNRATIRAMKEGDRIANDPNAKTYTDLNEMWTDLEK